MLNWRQSNLLILHLSQQAYSASSALVLLLLHLYSAAAAVGAMEFGVEMAAEADLVVVVQRRKSKLFLKLDEIEMLKKGLRMLPFSHSQNVQNFRFVAEDIC